MTVAAIVILKENELVQQFKDRGALSRATAMTPEALTISENNAFHRLRERGVIRDGAPGTYYLDAVAADARRDTRRRRLPMVLLIVLLAVAVAVTAGREVLQ